MLLVAASIGGVLALNRDGGVQVLLGPEDGSIDMPSTPTTEPDTSQPPSSTTPTTMGSGSVISPDGAEVAKDTVTQFIDDLRQGDTSAAAALWNGYPDAEPADISTKISVVDRFRTDFNWLVIALSVDMVVTPSFGHTTRLPVVTIVSKLENGEPRRAVAFVMTPDDPAQPFGMRIERLPTPVTDITPQSGYPISRGDRVVVPMVPVEGGATAYVNGLELSVAVDHESITTSMQIPPWVRDEALVTFSFATPEVPTATAVWYPLT